MPGESRLLWRVGPAADEMSDARKLGYVPQHVDVTAGRWVVNMLDVASAHGLPRILTYDSSRHPGVEELIILADLEPGRYTLRFSYLQQIQRRIRPGSNLQWDGPAEVMWEGRPPVRRDLQDDLLNKWVQRVDDQLDSANPSPIDMPFEEVDEYANQPNDGYFTIEMDGTEVGRGIIAFPHYTRDGDDVFDARTFAFELIAQQSGVRSITIRPRMLRSCKDPINGWFGRHASIRLAPVSVSLEKRSPGFAPPLQEGGLPGWHMLDAWGWQTSIWYQQDDPAGKSPQFLHQRAVRDAARWGANLVELYLSNVAEGRATPFVWTAQDGIDGWQDYREAKHPDWNADALEQFTRDSHARGLLQIFYTHYPYRPAAFYRAPNTWTQQLTRKILDRFANPLRQTAPSQIDHLSYESAGSTTSVCQLQLLRTISNANPGVSFAETNENLSRILPGLAPHHVGYMTSIARGWDDHAHVPGWLCHEPQHLESRWGRSLWGYQLNTRDIQFNSYGDCGPDWLLKQANDYVREGRAKRPDHPLVTAIWAINDSVAACSERNRWYIHAILMDPLRTAIAASLQTTGIGGVWQQRSARDEPYFHRARERFSCADHFVQNNYLRCVVRADTGELALQYDTDGTAHFDQDGTSLTLTDRLLATVSSAALTCAQRRFEILEPGGHLAQLRVRTEWQTNRPGCELVEQRTLTTCSDIPAVVVDLNFEHRGEHQQDIGLVLDCTGYRRMIVDGKNIDELARFESTDGTLILIDPDGMRPAMCIAWEGGNPFAAIDFAPGQRLTLWRRNPRTEANTQLRRLEYPLEERSFHSRTAIICQTDSLAENALESAARAVLSFPQHVELDNDRPAAVAPSAGGVTLIKVRGSHQGGPYAVNEAGWWRLRPGQPSQSEPDVDYVRLYCVDGNRPVIARSPWFENALRPGWGCQHCLAIGNIDAADDRTGCHVWVRSVSPLIFAPRVQAAGPISAVQLDGRPWHYFDDDHVMLPRRTGRCQLDIKVGPATSPHLTRTQAVVTETTWSKGSFQFTAELPAWQSMLPASQHLTAAIEHKSMSVASITGGAVLRSENERTLFAFNPGTVILKLK